MPNKTNIPYNFITDINDIYDGIYKVKDIFDFFEIIKKADFSDSEKYIYLERFINITICNINELQEKAEKLQVLENFLKFTTESENILNDFITFESKRNNLLSITLR